MNPMLPGFGGFTPTMAGEYQEGYNQLAMAGRPDEAMHIALIPTYEKYIAETANPLPFGEFVQQYLAGNSPVQIDSPNFLLGNNILNAPSSSAGVPTALSPTGTAGPLNGIPALGMPVLNQPGQPNLNPFAAPAPAFTGVSTQTNPFGVAAYKGSELLSKGNEWVADNVFDSTTYTNVQGGQAADVIGKHAQQQSMAALGNIALVSMHNSSLWLL